MSAPDFSHGLEELLRQDEDVRAARVDAMLAARRPDQRAAALAQRMSHKSGGAQ